MTDIYTQGEDTILVTEADPVIHIIESIETGPQGPPGTGGSGTGGGDGIPGTSGTSGTSSVSTSGTSGTSGTISIIGDGTSGTSGTSGVNGADGADGTSGTSGVNGADGADGTSGTSGASGIALIGGEMLWPTEIAPARCFEEDGTSLERSTYPELFAVIGTMYGAVDDTHFNLPDSRGKFPRIWAHGQTTDPDKATRTKPTAPGATILAGDHVGTEQEGDYKAHTHTAGPVAGSVALAGASAGNNWRLDSALPGTSSTAPATGGNETRPVNTYRMMIIRAY